jgi:hypothetical protein
VGQRWDWCWIGALGCTLEHLGDLDAEVCDARAVGERWDWVGDLVVCQREHVGCCLAQAVVSGDFREWCFAREPVDGECVANAAGAGHVALVAAAVLFGWADAPAVDAVRCHVGSLVWCDVDDDSGTWRGHGRFVEVEVAEETSAGRWLGLAP